MIALDRVVLCALIDFEHGKLDYIELPFGHAVVIGSIMCQRLLLKTRRRYYSADKGRLTLGRNPISVEVEVVREEYSMSTFRTG